MLATSCRACGSPFFSNIDLTEGSTRGAIKRKLEEANSLSPSVSVVLDSMITSAGVCEFHPSRLDKGLVRR